MKKPDPINKVHNQDEFSSGLMESYGRWMDGDTFQGTHMPDIHEAPFDGMDPQSNGAEIEQTSIKKKEVKKVTPVGAKETAPKNEEYEVLEREEFELNGEIWILEKRLYAVEGSMETARKNVGASTCWKGYKAKGTKMKGGKSVPNCVKEDEFHHQKDKDGNTIPHEDEIAEGKKGLYANIHAKRKRGESPAKPGDKGYPAKDAFKKAAESVEHVTEKKLDPVGKEDGDVDNDGDKDKSDKYLLARRKKVGKIIAMSKKK